MNIYLLRDFLISFLLFILGFKLLAKNLKLIMSYKLKEIINTKTNNRYKTILIGLLLTVIIQSSSAVILIVVSFLKLKILNIKQMKYLILGSNIGTTITLFILEIEIEKYFIYLVVAATILFFLPLKKSKNISLLIFSIFLIFYGIDLFGMTFQKIISNNYINLLLNKSLNNSIFSLIIGVFTAVVLQSSSTASILINNIYLANPNLLKGLLAVLLGVNIGTTSTIFLVALKDKEIFKVAKFHLFFNLFNALFFLLFLTPFYYLIISLTNLISDNYIIAIVNLIFNVVGVLGYILVIDRKRQPL